jgi:hypothetical protein
MVWRPRSVLVVSLMAGLLTSGLAVGVPVSPAGASAVVPVVTPSSTPALALDAPDPDVVLSNGTFYAFTTGTSWGNQIAIAKTTFSDPQLGWTTLSGQSSGSSAFAENGDTAPPAAWELNNTANSPGVFQYDGKWIMFYDAEDRSSGYYCLSVATASNVTGPYVDSSTGPLECQPSLGGSIDPQPFVDPTTGIPYLLWKSNDGSSSAASSVWSAPLGSDGVSLAGSPTAIFTIASGPYPWQATTDDPSMAYADGSYYLFFSGGNYLSSNYSTGYVLCSGPSGPCDQNEPSDPILTGPGGAGGGMVFTDASGNWWISYQVWAPAGCTNYSCGGQRQMYVAPISLSPDASPPPRAVPVDRIYGSDAIGTAIAVSQAEFPQSGSAHAVVLARSDFFSDALAGGPLAAQEGGPLLTTPGATISATLDPRVLAEIERVLPTGDTVYVLGGNLALSPQIDSSLQALGYVTQRIAGSDEFATAVDIAEQMGNPTTIFEATGLSFADALSAVPAAIEEHAAILLTNGSTQSLATYAYILQHLGDTRYAIGGPLAAAGADGGAMPVYGQDLYGTSAAVATTFFPDASVFGAATGLDFSDALAGGPFMAAPGVRGPMLLVEPTLPLPPAIATYLDGDAQLTSGYLFGGPLAVGNDVQAAL